jgi:predicted house-cleaning noncanonical NTP pyrophosphatase (MazG superfamily)
MKLVRDYIPEIIEADGKWCLCRRVHGVDEHMVWLKEKINEEAQEFMENPSYEEAADMVEVIKAFCHLNNLEWEVVLSSAVNKQETHGGFYSGIILQEVGKEKG